MSQLPSRLTAIVAATAVAGISGAAIAGAATSGSTTTSPTPSTQAPRPGAGETPLTGDTKQKVEAAALAKVPGTVIRTETDSDGVYESHIRKTDGTEVEVQVGKDFAVTAVQERPAGGGRGHGGPGGPGMHADLAAVAKDLGVTEADLTKAVEAARPQPPANGTRPQDGAEEAAAIAKELGVDASAVQQVLDANRPDHGPGRSGDDAALVAALVKQFSVSEAQAQAAVTAAEKAEQADHQARETAMYAAIAKALGKDAAAVQKAFEANRPARP